METKSDPTFLKQFRTVRTYLRGEAVDKFELWAAVGYFVHGAGKFGDKPWETQDELSQLLLATERDPIPF